MQWLHWTPGVQARTAEGLAQRVDDELSLSHQAILRMALKQTVELGMTSHTWKGGVHESRHEVVAADPRVERRTCWRGERQRVVSYVSLLLEQ